MCGVRSCMCAHVYKCVCVFIRTSNSEYLANVKFQKDVCFKLQINLYEKSFFLILCVGNMKDGLSHVVMTEAITFSDLL